MKIAKVISIIINIFLLCFYIFFVYIKYDESIYYGSGYAPTPFWDIEAVIMLSGIFITTLSIFLLIRKKEILSIIFWETILLITPMALLLFVL